MAGRGTEPRPNTGRQTGNSSGLDLSSLPPPVAVDSDVTPEQAAAAIDSLDAVYRKHRANVEKARSEFTHAEAAWRHQVAAARKAAAQASTPQTIRSVGMLQRVTLKETSIVTLGQEHPLTPEVQARAEQHGFKQVVQGWIFKSTHDRREVYLHVEGPDWALAIPYGQTGPSPRAIHAFAAQVGAAARRIESTKAKIAKRTEDATRALAVALSDRTAFETAVSQFAETAGEDSELVSARLNVERKLAGRGQGRASKRAARLVVKTREDAERWASEAEQLRLRVERESAAVRSESESILHSLQVASRKPAEGAPELSTLAEAHEIGVAGGEPALLDQIEKLGELRDAGLLTPDEFEDKKAQLLDRL